MGNNYCINCGEPIADEKKACTNCGKPRMETGTGDRNPAGNVVYVKEKSAAAAIILSFIFTGAGQVYNGKLKKGLLMMAGFWIGMIFFVPAVIIWIYSMYDAYKDADKMNKGELPFAESTAKDAVIYIIAYFVLVFIFCILFFTFFFMLSLLMFGL